MVQYAWGAKTIFMYICVLHYGSMYISRAPKFTSSRDTPWIGTELWWRMMQINFLSIWFLLRKILQCTIWKNTQRNLKPHVAIKLIIFYIYAQSLAQAGFCWHWPFNSFFISQGSGIRPVCFNVLLIFRGSERNLWVRLHIYLKKCEGKRGGECEVHGNPFRGSCNFPELRGETLTSVRSLKS